MSTTAAKTGAWSAGMSQDKMAWDALQNPHESVGLPLVKAGHPMRIREAHGWRMTLHQNTQTITVHMPDEDKPLLTLPGDGPPRWNYLANKVGYVVLYASDDLGLPLSGGEQELQRQLMAAAERGRLVAASIAYSAL